MRLLISFFIISLVACNSNEDSALKHIHQLKVEKLSYGSDYWKYSIIREGKTLITQEFVPAFRGEQHFYDSTSALVVGRLMKEKLDKGILPPSLSKSEIIDVWPMNAVLPEE